MKPKTEQGVTTAVVEPADKKAFDNAIDRLIKLQLIEKDNSDRSRSQTAAAVIAGLRSIGRPKKAAEADESAVAGTA